MIYLAIFNSLIFLRYLNYRNSYFYIMIGLFLFTAFRFEVGCDWSGYLNQFNVYNGIGFGDLAEYREPIWIGLFTIQHWLELPYPWINVFSAAIFFFGVHVLARSQPDPLGFLILLFPILIVNMPMSGIRQGAAIGLMCIAFSEFINKSFIRFIFITLLASALHSSAIVFVFFAPFVTGEYDWRRIVLAAILAVPGMYIIYSGSDAELARARYVDTAVDAAGGLFRVALIAFSGILFLLVFRGEWKKRFRYDYKFVHLSSFAMISLLPLVAMSSVIGDRLGYYFIPIQTMILSRITYLNLGALKQIYVVAPYVLLTGLFLVWILMSPIFEQCYTPYRSWLFGYPEMSKYFY